jgi:hypothetical protein
MGSILVITAIIKCGPLNLKRKKKNKKETNNE